MPYRIRTIALAIPILASTASAQQLPPIRQLGPVVAKTNQPFTAIVSVRALSGGKVLVNDFGSRKVVLFDSSLTNGSIVADTTSATSNAYSGRMGGLLAYRGDSSLFVDPQSMSMMVISPAGQITRVMSVPRSQDAAALAGVAFGAPGFDAQGRLVYRAQNRFMMGGPSARGGLPTPPAQPDSAPIVRVDLATRQLDTIGMVKIPKVNFQVTQDERGGIRMTSEVNPLPLVDDWAVLSDGSVALVRGRDYHVDFVNADGTRSSAPKVPFEWQRLTDEDKVAFIDSVKAQRARMAASAPAGATTGGNAVTSAGPPGAPGEVRMMVFGGPGGPGGPGAGGPGGPGGAPPQLNFVAPSELPDYKPPFFAGSVRADANANLWIRTIPTKAIPGGPVYDVINRKGELVDRVQIPQGRSIVGFGPDGAVYLTSRDGNVMVLERAGVK